MDTENKDNLYEARKANFEDKKERRIDKYKTRARKARVNSDQHSRAAENAIAGIPSGQPILIGHHSERRHRAALKRHDNQMRKTIEEQDKAQYYAEKAAAAESNTAISSDDPDAIKLLKEKITALKIQQDFMKRANKEFKKLKAADERGEKYKMQLTEQEKAILLNAVKRMPSYERQPYPSYELTSVNNRIKTAENRIKQLTAFEQMEVKAGRYEIPGIPECQFEKDKVENRFKIYPPSKDKSFAMGLPGIFKRYGFHWSPMNKCYQRQLSGIGYAETIIIDELKKALTGK